MHNSFGNEHFTNLFPKACVLSGHGEQNIALEQSIFRKPRFWDPVSGRMRVVHGRQKQKCGSFLWSISIFIKEEQYEILKAEKKNVLAVLPTGMKTTGDDL